MQDGCAVGWTPQGLWLGSESTRRAQTRAVLSVLKGMHCVAPALLPSDVGRLRQVTGLRCEGQRPQKGEHGSVGRYQPKVPKRGKSLGKALMGLHWLQVE